MFFLIAAIVKHKFSLFPSMNRIDSHSPAVPRLFSSLFGHMALYTRQRHLPFWWRLAILTAYKTNILLPASLQIQFQNKNSVPSTNESQRQKF